MTITGTIIISCLSYSVAAGLTSCILGEQGWDSEEIFAGSVVWPILLLVALCKYTIPTIRWVADGFVGLWGRRPTFSRPATPRLWDKLFRLRRGKKDKVPKARVINE